jgi:hypothetical protein
VQKSDFTIKKFKECQGSEGKAYSCDVYIAGKKAFTAQQGGHGGETEYWPYDKALLDEAYEFVKTLGKVPGYDFDYNLDIFIEDVIGEIQDAKKIARLCKAKTVFTSGGKTYSINRPFSPESMALVLKGTPDAVFLNK